VSVVSEVTEVDAHAEQGAVEDGHGMTVYDLKDVQGGALYVWQGASCFDEGGIEGVDVEDG
jgi:hypothetical protein